MAVDGIKSFASRIHSDEELRRQFASDPDRVLSQFKLSPAEKAAIKRAGEARGVDAGTLDWWFM